MKVTINKEECIGCDVCETTCQDIFELHDGKSRVKKGKTGELSDKDIKCAKEAEESCPVQAIKLK
ncbi:MAG: ferredoxin [Parcubacteria group bacterium]|nr:ferredoxin [Parcubacteria group bacterium]